MLLRTKEYKNEDLISKNCGECAYRNGKECVLFRKKTKLEGGKNLLTFDHIYNTSWFNDNVCGARKTQEEYDMLLNEIGQYYSTKKS